MHLYQYGPDTARRITQYNSTFALTPIVRTAANPEERVESATDPSVQIVCMHIAAGEIVGYHRAVTPQLFSWSQERGGYVGRSAYGMPSARFWRRSGTQASGTRREARPG